MRLKLTASKIADQLGVGVSHIMANGDGSYWYIGKDELFAIKRRLHKLNTYAFNMEIINSVENQDGLNYVRFCLVVKD